MRETPNTVIEDELVAALKKIENEFNSNTLTFIGGLHYGADDIVRDFINGRGLFRIESI